MSPENPFEKAKKKADEQREEGSRNAGTLNSLGQGGPTHDRMMDSMRKLGTPDSNSPDAVKRIRQAFEARLHKRGLDIYNQHLEGKTGSVPHSQFAEDVQKSFELGFSQYLKVALRLDQKDAPERRPSYYGKTGGGGKIYIADQMSESDYLEMYLTRGREILDDTIALDGRPEDHNFDPPEDFTAYRDKYARRPSEEERTAQQKLTQAQEQENNLRELRSFVPSHIQEAIGDSRDIIQEEETRDALDAYMFEKMRLFSTDYFDMLDASLREDIPYKNSLLLAQRVYGYTGDIYDEMKEQGLSSKTIATLATQYPAKVRLHLETYLEQGPDLEREFPYQQGSGSWVSGPNTIRNLIFKHPTTAERGIRIFDQQVKILRDQYLNIPQRLLINACAKNPDDHVGEINRIQEHAQVMMDDYPMVEEYLPLPNTEGSNLFAHYQAQSAIISFLDRVAEKNQKRELRRVVNAFVGALGEAQDRGLDLRYNTRRRILRKLLSVNTSVDRILKREEKRDQEKTNEEREWQEKGLAKDEFWGAYYYDIGWGANNRERLSTGEAAVDLAREQYGDAEAEDYVIDCLDIFEAYRNSKFSEDETTLNHLKDAIFSAPHETKKFFEETLGQQWPQDIEELAFSEAE